MKLESLFLGIRLLKAIENNPNCTIPQIKENLGVSSLNPPGKEEKNLYKVISFISNHGLIDKINKTSISHRGAHYYLKITPKGSQLLLDLRDDLMPQSYIIKGGDRMENNVFSSITTEFSKKSYEILNNLLQDLLYELPKDSRLFLSANRSRIKSLIEKSHLQLQEKFRNLMDSLI